MRTPRPWPLPQQPASRAQLQPLGVTRAMIETQLRNGALLRLRPGVYLDATRWPDDPAGQHLLRGHAALVTQPAGVLSHTTAAVIWGLPSPDFAAWQDGPVELTAPLSASHHHTAGVIVHRTDRLPTHQVTHDPDGYAVTTVARTAVDLARRRDLPQSLVLLDAAARQLVGSLTANPRRADYANPRLAGAARTTLVDAVGEQRAPGLMTAIAQCDPRCETPIESLSMGHLRLAGLPIPECQPRLVTARGSFYPDFLWRAERLIGEADGAEKYRSGEIMLAEKEREQILRDLGFRFVRWLGREIIWKPAIVMARIERALLWSGPSGRL
ncbi:MAG: DUF559 domain-containing protein [Propionicimonas sp.]|uniref:DUF559 domain-containing protein n=1 Tax=Propionicimonas sp. TaxID=1955623 RepID=UPI002B1EE2A9|nr:DUF559 domain-containing protein [Propionicimonas sp.]MEA4943031.1 DUF559 domain-containing protein [Propionicimonas sp.]